MTKKIAILGCGWLGLPLAISLEKKKHQLNGATTSVDKILNLARHNINPFLIAVHQQHIEGNISYFLKDVDILIINIPPRIKKNSGHKYVSKIQTLSKKIEQSGVKKVIFASSSSVYASKNDIVDENTPPSPETESGKQILTSEKILSNNPHFKTTIIRFAGLYGNDRHPVNSLSGRKNIANPRAPVNLIHLTDCIGIINAVIDKEIWGKTFNAVAPQHPERKDFYVEKAHKMGVLPPTFKETTKTKGKTVTSILINKYLDYHFAFPDLSD
ncbi:SDR family NAD(P)-dependent oxidoreductase [Galbibacter sp. PAP.153]|uniref:SDR family NAD(P)-dependent oxidoreductase n=1 Tax=Galbibacter sp. PAP.153 TaxID=3104623 RepID=UPI0030093D49